MTRWRAITALLAALAAAAPASRASASLPPPPLPRDYYGPVRVCGEGYAFDALAGEAYSVWGSGDNLRFPGGGLTIGSWIYERIDVSKAVKPLGAVELRGGVRLQRFRTDWGDRKPEIVYHYDRGTGYFRILEVRSNRFDGSEGDLTLLRRIAFGKAAEPLCASIPEALRPTPERENWDAYHYDPRIRPGPLTVCLVGLAFDVRAGEAALLPWMPHSKRFRLLGPDRLATDINLQHWTPLPAAAAGRSIAAMPGVEVMEGSVLTDGRGPGPEDERKRHLRLVHPDSSGFIDPDGLAQALFAFDPAISETGARTMLARLRTQRPADRCAASAPA